MEEDKNRSQDEQITSDVERVDQPNLPEHIQESLGKPETVIVGIFTIPAT